MRRLLDESAPSGRSTSRFGHKPLTLVAVLLAAISSAPRSAAAQPLPALDDVIQHLDDLYRSDAARARMSMRIVRPRGTRELTLETWSKGRDRALVVIRAPAREAGTATLRTAEGLWSYGARADRLIRIPNGLLAENWMGSHLTNDDLVRETSYQLHYESTLSWTTRDGTRYLQVTLTPRPNAPVVYSRMVFLLTAADWTPVRYDFYDDAGVTRTMLFDDVRQLAGHRVPMRVIVQPTGAPNESTVIEYLELQLDASIDDELFTRRGLRRVAAAG
jgi:outer membrane lipoprotein-sorting protein